MASSATIFYSSMAVTDSLTFNSRCFTSELFLQQKEQSNFWKTNKFMLDTQVANNHMDTKLKSGKYKTFITLLDKLAAGVQAAWKGDLSQSIFSTEWEDCNSYSLRLQQRKENTIKMWSRMCYTPRRLHKMHSSLPATCWNGCGPHRNVPNCTTLNILLCENFSGMLPANIGGILNISDPIK